MHPKTVSGGELISLASQNLQIKLRECEDYQYIIMLFFLLSQKYKPFSQVAASLHPQVCMDTLQKALNLSSQIHFLAPSREGVRSWSPKAHSGIITVVTRQPDGQRVYTGILNLEQFFLKMQNFCSTFFLLLGKCNVIFPHASSQAKAGFEQVFTMQDKLRKVRQDFYVCEGKVVNNTVL